MKKIWILIFLVSISHFVPFHVRAEEEAVQTDSAFDEEDADFGDEDTSTKTESDDSAVAEDDELDAEVEDSEETAEANEEPIEEPKKKAEVEKEQVDEDVAAEEDTGDDSEDEDGGEIQSKDMAEDDLEPATPQQLESEKTPPMETADLGGDVPQADDSIDDAYEARLHDIYVNFYNSKTPEDEWRSLVGSRKVERYDITQGDNLWVISKTIFGDGNYWPKVWSLNSTIANPHLISPNNTIKFVLGSESEPPSFTVSEKVPDVTVNTVTEQPTPPPTPTPAIQAPSDSEPEIPPPLKPVRPVVRNFPPSLPQWQAPQSVTEKYDSMGIDYGVRKISLLDDSVWLPGYIAEKPPEPLGFISEMEVGHNMAASYQYIYISMRKGKGDVGDNYLVVQNRGEVKSVHPSIKGDLGYAIDIQGEVQLIEKVESRDDDFDMYRALTLRTVNPISTDGYLVEGGIEKVQITEKGPRSQVVAQIIGGVYFNKRQIYGSESFAFLNRGETDGLAEGQVLPIRANRLVRNSDTKVASNIRPIGWLRIVKTTPRFSTAVVVRSWSDILTGDLTGAGEILNAGSASSDDDFGDSKTALKDEMENPDNEAIESDSSESTDSEFEDAEDSESSDL